MQLNRPRAAINDCTAALEINPDSAKAFKIRAKAKEIKAAAVQKRNKDAEAEFHRKLQADKEAYEAGLKAREAEWKEAKEKEEEEKRQKEEERKARARAREAEEGGGAAPEADGVPKSHGPPSGGDAPPDPPQQSTAEDVD